MSFFRRSAPVEPAAAPGPAPEAPPGEDPGRGAFAGLERVLLRAAVGAARISLSLQKVARGNASLGKDSAQIQGATERMVETIMEVAEGAQRSAEDAREMAGLTRTGRQASEEAIAASQRLREHTAATGERLQALMTRIQEVTQVSRVIEDIATRTNLLALNAAIEAAHAGHAGRGFAVVAEEVRKLAVGTSQQTQEIDALLQAVVADLEPARQAMTDSLDLAERAMAQTQVVGQQLESILGLAEKTSTHVADIANITASQTEVIYALNESVRSSMEDIASQGEQTSHIAAEAFALSGLTEDGYSHLADFDTGSQFFKALKAGRHFRDRCAEVLAAPVRDGRLRLEQVLDLEYREITGPEVQSLARLFDVSRVPITGFTPPKFATAYDALVDEALQPLFDGLLAEDPRLIFGVVLDLNSYAPTHNRICMQDWTGDPARDLAGNRIKRFFTDARVLVRGARAGLGQAAMDLPDRSSRDDFRRVCDLAETGAQRDGYLVQTYARDTGALVTALSIPLFVQGQRYGAAFLGWQEDGSG